MKEIFLKKVAIPTVGATIQGDLLTPSEPLGLIIFSHGSGSSRFSPRNRFVAQVLNQSGFATLLIDLLTEQEDANPQNRFNISLLTDRLSDVTAWMFSGRAGSFSRIGYFGASTGAASAFRAAAQYKERIFAIVSRGGRTDLATGEMMSVKSPSLLIAGGNDDSVIEINRASLDLMKCEKMMMIVPGASHLFEEPGTLAHVADLANGWFMSHVKNTVLKNDFQGS